MIYNNLIKVFIDKRFSLVETNIKDILVLVKTEQETMNTCILVKNTEGKHFNGKDLEIIEEQFTRKFLLNGMRTINILFMVLSDNIERDKRITNSNVKFWLLDSLSRTVRCYENQPEEYLGLREPVQKALRDEIKVSEKMNIPFATISLIAVNVIVFIILSMYGSTEDVQYMLEHGASYSKYIFEDYEFYRLITCMFLHFGIAHLANNMITLALVGTQLERMVGIRRFYLFYFLSGIGASLISAFYHYINGEYVVSAGASGAIYGLIGAIIILLFKNRKNAGRMFGLRFIFLVLIIVYSGVSTGGIDVVAHVIGLLLGMLLASVFYSEKDTHIKI